MSVTVKPWPRGGYMVTIRFRWDDLTVFRDRRICDMPTASRARRWGEQRERDIIAAGKPKPEDKARPKAKVLTVAAFAPTWLETYCEGALQKASWVAAAESILRVHIVPLIGSLPLDQVTNAVVAKLRASWAKGAYRAPALDGKSAIDVRPSRSKKTHNNRASVLSMMLTKAVECGAETGLREMPCAIKMDSVDVQKTPTHYDHETYERLVEGAAACDPRILALVLLAGDGGLRRGECIGLDLADVDFRAGRMTVRRSVFVKAGKRFVDETKGGKEKPVPLTPRLLDALQALRHLRGPRALYMDEGKELTPKIVRLWIERAERKAGLPVTGKLHVLRHTFCSHAAMGGVPAKTIQELARHSDLAVTMRYMHLSPSALDEGIAMLTRSREQGGVPVVRANIRPTTSGK